MKKLLLTAIILLLNIIVIAQTKPKSAEEKPPTKKELEQMMKQAQKEMDNLSPEDKKMLDSMGVKLPSVKNIPNISDKQMAAAREDENRVVPKRDVLRIAAIPKAVTDSKMGAYIAAIQNKSAAVLNPTVASMGNKACDYIKSTSKNTGEAGNMATTFYMAGQPEIALFVLGKICTTDVSNTDNLSNYASLLVMQGAQHLAIPILNNLNSKYPKNSTLLNNLGQAWFGLGEIDKAEKYLDSAIRFYTYHPQANLTKSFIEESKGNKQGAIDAAKRSIAKAYSIEKAGRLNKLGYKLKTNDVAWDRPMPQDPLGLEKFKRPEYPMNVAESEILEDEWDAFKKICEERIAELKMQEKTLEKVAEEANGARTKQLLQAGNKGTMVNPWPPLAYKAMVKLNYIIDDKISFSYQKKISALTNSTVETEKLEDILSNKLKIIRENYKDQFGEGKSNPFDAACTDDTKAKDAFLGSSNSLMRNTFNDFIAFMRRKINNEMYYDQYTMWPENFELAKVQAKISWLSLISSWSPKFKDKSIWCQEKTDVEVKPFKLANFDDIACAYKSSLNMGCFKMETNCGQTTTTYGCGELIYIQKELGQNYIGGTLKISPKVSIGGNEGPLSAEGSIGGDFTIELDENNQVKEWEGKVTTGVKAGVGIHKGPVKAGASISSALELEIGSNGITDINIVSAAKIKAGIAAPKSAGSQKIDEQINKGIGYANKGIEKLSTSVELGVESRTSLISGHGSVSGTGALSGVKMSNW